jgi:hypothetical protein
MFPFTRLDIQSLLPVHSLPLSPQEIKEIIDTVPPPPGVGNTALKIARNEQERVLGIMLRGATLLCDQRSYHRIKKVFRESTPLLVLERKLRSSIREMKEDESGEEKGGELKKEGNALSNRLLDELRQAVRETIKERFPARKDAEELSIGLPENASQIKRLFETLPDARRVDPRLLDEFKEETAKRYATAYIAPGSAVGIQLAQSIGSNTLQLNLSGFHTAGSNSSNADGFTRLRDLLYNRREKKVEKTKIKRDPRMYLHFLDMKKLPATEDMHTVVHTGTFESILARRPMIEEVTVANLLLTTPRLLDREEIKEVGLTQLIRIHKLLRRDKLSGMLLENPAYALELRLDLVRMFTHQITMKMVAEAIEYRSQRADTIACLWQSQSVKSERNGFLYILTDEKKNFGPSEMDEDAAIVQLLNHEIRARFKLFHISGIPNITHLLPVQQDVLEIVTHAEKEFQEWKVYARNSIDELRPLIKSLEAKGFDIKEYKSKREQKYLVVFSEQNLEEKLPPLDEKKVIDRVVKDRPLWRVFINKLLTRLRGISLADVRELFIAANFALPQPDNMSRRGGYVYVYSEMNPIKTIREMKDPPREVEARRYIYMAIASGINIPEIVWLEDLDRYRFHTNSVTEMENYFGIDITRFYLIEEFYRILETSGININRRHISLLFDFLTNPGVVTSITITGVRRRKIDPLVDASNERAVHIFKEAAAMGREEIINRASSSIYVGTLAPFHGGGIYTVAEQPGVTEDPTEEPERGEDPELLKEERMQVQRIVEPILPEWEEGEEEEMIPILPSRAHISSVEEKEGLSLSSQPLREAVDNIIAGSVFNIEDLAKEFDISLETLGLGEKKERKEPSRLGGSVTRYQASRPSRLAERPAERPPVPEYRPAERPAMPSYQPVSPRRPSERPLERPAIPSYQPVSPRRPSERPAPVSPSYRPSEREEPLSPSAAP